MSPEYCYNATIINVVDGDTVDAVVQLGFHVQITERFRLSRIDAPETYGVKKESEEYKAGLLAKERLIELIENKKVVIKTEKKDKYGRYLAEIYVDNQSINEILLNEGLVKAY